jgi:hypothetical protein
MEFTRQATEVNVIFSAQHKVRCHSFPMQLEFYYFQTSVMVNIATEEFQALNLRNHTLRKNFDPKEKMNSLYS